MPHETFWTDPMTYEEQMKERLRDIKEHPENHHHAFGALTACCTIQGILDTHLMEAHTRYAPLGYNGGEPCDVTSGPCSCGAWH